METQKNNSNNATAGKFNTDYAKKVGDAIEKVGDKVEHSGFKKTGDAIESIGDNIEHLNDKRGSKKDSETDIVGMATDWVSTATKRAGEFEQRVQSAVMKRPIPYILGAIAIGFVASKFLFKAAKKEVTEGSK